ncbi:hypothetical protein [[Phormidium] sp. ETS-05]|nr:hypothetical protein [[Phormidium] sp. ETS-05]
MGRIFAPTPDICPPIPDGGRHQGGADRVGAIRNRGLPSPMME